MKKLVALVAVAVALATAGSAGAWHSNDWRTPSGNIYCHWGYLDTGNMFPAMASPAMTCGMYSPWKVVRLYRYGRARWEPRGISTFMPFWGDMSNVVLPYGTRYTAPGVTCYSNYNGLLCKSSSGHGFFLSRQSSRVW